MTPRRPVECEHGSASPVQPGSRGALAGDARGRRRRFGPAARGAPGLEFRTLVVTAERRYSPTVMTPSPVPGAAVTQFAVLHALLADAYESGPRVAEARSIGDFGLGCVDHLGGEVVIVDDEAIEYTLDGPPLAMDDDDI
jgi:Alpha-acetolactate decarboxylase